MSRKQRKIIVWETYLIPLALTIILFILLGYIITKSINEFVFQNKTDEAYRLANSHMLRLTSSLEASKIINELLEEKIEGTIKIAMKNKEQLSNEFLKELSQDLNIDKIYWYNSNGEIIYTANDYLGWKATPGTPEYEFMHGDKEFLIEPSREDVDSDIKLKYAEQKLEDGGFIQIGIFADNIWELTNRFCPQKLIDQLVEEKDIVHAYILNENNNITFCNDIEKQNLYQLDEMEKIAVEKNRIYSDRNIREGINTFEVLLPIYIEQVKIGTLVIFYSLDDLDELARYISSIALTILSMMFIVYGMMVTQIAKKNKKIEKLAYYDPLLEQPNKNYFKEFLKNKLKAKEEGQALLLLNYKNINLVKLVYGEKRIDDFFIDQMSLLKEVNSFNNVFRYDEENLFIYLENYKDKNDLILTSKTILELFDIGAERLNIHNLITMQVGILEINKDYTNIQDIITDARIAGNKSSEHKGERYSFFNQKMKDELLLNEKIKEKLSQAIQEGNNEEFYLEYQPQIDLKTNEIVGLEALARWNNKELGNIPPHKFIGIAEKYQLITPFGEWIIKEVCKFLVTLYEQGITNIKIAVNISAIQLLEEDFITNIIKIIKNMGVQTKNLEFEITETGLIDNYQIINTRLNILRKEGISISIDDFGIGYSSLSRLRNLNIDVLKIDKSFIDNITCIEQDDIFIQNIISLCKQLDLKIIAEGVETEVQREYLFLKQCDMMQGYLFSKPLSGKKIIGLLN